MPFPSIKAIIAAEQATSDIFGRVRGTPRTYGSRKNDDIWRACVRDGQWTGLDRHPMLIDASVFLTFSFRINPRSRLYGPGVYPNGRDIDTMVIGALDGLIAGRGNDRPSLRLLSRAGNCWGYAAVKELVGTDNDTGVDITVSLRPPISLSEFRGLLPPSNFTVTIPRGKKRQETAKVAVESHNSNQRFFPACSPISMAIAFAASGRQRNFTSADHIEALIDGMGAAVVGERRLFDGSAGAGKERYGFDDSCIYSLLVGRFDHGDPGIDAGAEIYSEPAEIDTSA